MFDLKGRVAVITGASSGLGKQMTRAFAKQGANLVILARRIERLEELKTELEKDRRRFDKCSFKHNNCYKRTCTHNLCKIFTKKISCYT